MRFAVVLVLLAGIAHRLLGEATYNGIDQGAAWPPPIKVLTLQPTTVPYLTSRPAVIAIDVGRQLFVDDFLIDRTTLRRTFHLPEYFKDNPVLKPDKAWEHESDGPRQGPMAMPFSDGVWYDPKDRLFKMWYFADYHSRHLCYATSKNGLQWDKPSLDVVPGTNIVFPKVGGANVVWLDLQDEDPQRRYKLVVTGDGADLIAPDQEWYGTKSSMFVHFSPDGIHWSGPKARTGPSGDRNSAFYNPFRGRWVFSIRSVLRFADHPGPMRCRTYWESPDLVTGLPWGYAQPSLWVGADRLDLRHGRFAGQPELYNLDAVAYESLLIGMFAIMRAYADEKIGRPKINEVCVGYSRDGFHWHRPDRRSFLRVSERQGDWNWGNVQSAGGCCLIVGDKLHFYFSGRSGSPPHFHDAGGSTGLAFLRRDGFASMDAVQGEGELTTRPLRFGGRYVFVNADTRSGELRVEILGEDGRPLAPFTLANCAPIRSNRTLQPVEWSGAKDLSDLAGKSVRFRFRLSKGSLYSFWVGPDESGASHGYVAGGGPGFTGPTDTAGVRSYGR